MRKEPRTLWHEYSDVLPYVTVGNRLLTAMGAPLAGTIFYNLYYSTLESVGLIRFKTITEMETDALL